MQPAPAERVSISNQEDSALSISQMTVGVFGFAVAIYLLLNKPILSDLFSKIPTTSTRAEQFRLLASVFGPAFLLNTVMAIAGRVGSKSKNPVLEEEKGTLLAANLLFRHSITHLLIFVGVFFGWAETVDSVASDFALKQFLGGYVAYAGGTALTQVLGLKGLESFGFALMAGAELQIGLTLLK